MRPYSHNFGSLVQAVQAFLKNFFLPTFADSESEESFQKERWYNTKLLAWLACGFMILNWLLYFIFVRFSQLSKRTAFGADLCA